MDLDRDLPLLVEDARTASVGEWEVQGAFRFERLRRDDTRVTLQPEIQTGLTDAWQVSLGVPVYAGDQDRGTGDLYVDTLFRLFDESGAMPALAIGGRVIFPTGRQDNEGLDTEVRLAATKSLDDQRRSQVHLNGAWGHNAAPGDDERSETWLILVGYSRRLTDETALVADLWRRWQVESRSEANVVEVGLRHEFTDDLTLAAGVGAGLGAESPRWLLSLGFEWTF